MTVRLIPERTIDSLLAFELMHAVPTGVIWSPSNTRGQWDHAFVTGTRTLVFECKGIVSNPQRDPTAPWTVPLDTVQLNDYVQAGLDLTYLLPARPAALNLPWIRSCTVDPDASGHCIACTAFQNEPKDARRWAGGAHHVRTSPEHVRCQPWFNHWAWCVPAHSLLRQVGTAHRHVSLDARDRSLGAMPDAERLCHVLAAARRAHDDEHDGTGVLEQFLLPAGVVREAFGAATNWEPISAEEEGTPPLAISF